LLTIVNNNPKSTDRQHKNTNSFRTVFFGTVGILSARDNSWACVEKDLSVRDKSY